MTKLILFGFLALLCVRISAQDSTGPFRPVIPKLWYEKELAAMTLPAARQEGRIVYVSSEYPIYKTYPVYLPTREPTGYLDRLKQQEPVLAFNPSKLKTKA